MWITLAPAIGIILALFLSMIAHPPPPQCLRFERRSPATVPDETMRFSEAERSAA